MTDLTDVIAQKLHELTLANKGVSRGAVDMRSDAVALVKAIGDSGATVIWQAIATIAYTTKGTGNDFLLWCEGGASIGYWSDSGPNAGEWLNHDDEIVNPTHYSLLPAPE